MNRRSVFMQVTEDWHGNYTIADDMRHLAEKYIRVSFLPLHDGSWRVCAWGNDDFGMEKDFSPSDMLAAFSLYILTISESLPTQGWFLSNGFQRV